MKRADTHKGFVWGVDGDNIIITLHRGGRLTTPNKGGFDTGDEVAVIFSINSDTVIEVRPLAQVKTAIRCGSDPFFEASIRDAELLPDIEEEIYDEDICYQPTDVLYCGG